MSGTRGCQKRKNSGNGKRSDRNEETKAKNSRTTFGPRSQSVGRAALYFLIYHSVSRHSSPTSLPLCSPLPQRSLIMLASFKNKEPILFGRLISAPRRPRDWRRQPPTCADSIDASLRRRSDGGGRPAPGPPPASAHGRACFLLSRFAGC